MNRTSMTVARSAARRLAVMAMVALTLTSCTKAASNLYYAGMEKLGRDKRDILVSRVAKARDAQEEAKEQVKTTLETLQGLTGFQGGELESKYKDLKSDYERCEKRASDLTERIDSVEKVSNDLFAEWTAEIEQIERADYRQSSQRMLNDTRQQSTKLIAAMRRSEAKLPPVLKAFNDQVLFLKHNLNAQAISSLKGTAVEIESDVSSLIRDMERSIAEADSFIKDMKDG